MRGFVFKVKGKLKVRRQDPKVGDRVMFFRLGNTLFNDQDLVNTKPSRILEAFNDEAYALDRSYFFYGRYVSNALHPDRKLSDYNFDGANFEWRPIATKGTGNGGWFVAVKPVTPAARKLMWERDQLLQTIFSSLDVKAMIHSKNRFFEVVDILWDVFLLYGSGRLKKDQFPWLKWDGDKWLRRFAAMDLSAWWKVERSPQEVQDIARMCGSIPRLNNVQALVKVGMGI